jgi:hypothetical protein
MELQRADPKLRVVVASLVLAAIVGGVGVLALMREWLEGSRQLPPSAAQSQLLAALDWCTGLLCLSLAAFAAYLWRLGAKVILHAQWPLPRARVFRDTPVLRGQAARRRGRWLQGLAVALVACGIALAVVAWRLHVLLSSSA